MSVIKVSYVNVVYKGNYTRIQYSRPVIDSTIGFTKVISRMNLCNVCFNDYKNLIQGFTGREFKENIDSRTNLEYLKQLREQMISTNESVKSKTR